ncbi:hypothetical protein MPNT_240012 [Candidatus Methylacidithermus pantelleriae]|uniref:Uncharacterized protein n=1 Tax=Candidatus Methylacidithermus pantelleriae TaxID=2744239 RepID=A0A8J2BPZ3_9BACT|nr:hypothetical protein MPNT_240012 [Candidatus Methylacidithermus pantelleriae]
MQVRLGAEGRVRSFVVCRIFHALGFSFDQKSAGSHPRIRPVPEATLASGVRSSRSGDFAR